MANPGYPPMGGSMQPMGPMGAMGMPRQAVRQGTSHMVPIVVSAGLAIGVFCGLLFGLGTKHEPEPVKVSNGVKPHDDGPAPDTASATPTPSKPAVKPPQPPPATGSNAGTAAATTGGAAATTANAAATGSAAGTGAAAVEPKPGKLTIDIKPDSAAQAAKILVDGKPVTGIPINVPFDKGVTKKTLKVLVQVPGYKDIEKDVEIESDRPATIAIDLGKARPATSGGGTPASDSGNGGHGTSGNDSGAGKGSSGNGKGSGSGKKGTGLIDI